MAFIAPVISGLGALFGLFGGRSSTSTTNFNSATTPTYDPQTLAFKNLLEQAYTNEVSPTAENTFGQEYTTAGAKNIQTSANLAEQAAQDALSERGIARTTAGSEAVSNTSQSEGQNLSTFLNQAPLLLDQRNQSLLSNAGGFLASLPVGSSTTGSSTTTGNTAPSFSLPGLVQGAASATAGIYGQQAAQNSLTNILKSINAPTTIAGASTGAGSTAGQLGTITDSPSATSGDIMDDDPDYDTDFD